MSVEPGRVTNAETVERRAPRETGVVPPTVSSARLNARRPWAGDWRLPDERADREHDLYYDRSRSTEEYS